MVLVRYRKDFTIDSRSRDTGDIGPVHVGDEPKINCEFKLRRKQRKANSVVTSNSSSTSFKYLYNGKKKSEVFGMDFQFISGEKRYASDCKKRLSQCLSADIFTMIVVNISTSAARTHTSAVQDAKN